MKHQQQESRPAPNGTALHQTPTSASKSLPILAPEVVEHLDGALVLLVRTHAGRHRRRVFMTVKSAERAADRATDAGHTAEVVLCRLAPVGVIDR